MTSGLLGAILLTGSVTSLQLFPVHSRRPQEDTLPATETRQGSAAEDFVIPCQGNATRVRFAYLPDATDTSVLVEVEASEMSVLTLYPCTPESVGRPCPHLSDRFPTHCRPQAPREMVLFGKGPRESAFRPKRVLVPGNCECARGRAPRG